MRWRTAMTAALTAPVILACGGGDSTGLEGDSLTQAEAAALASEVFILMGEVLSGVSFTPAAAGGPFATSAPITFSDSFNYSAPCDLSGTASATASVDGTYDGQTGEFDYSYVMVMDFVKCAVQTSTGGTFTLNGAPNLTITGDWQQVNAAGFTYDYSMTGGFSYSSADGRSGSCTINFTSSLSSTGTATSSGSFCGVSFSG